MKQRCRCCLTTNSNSFYYIFEKHKSGITYAEHIRYLADIQVDLDDELPVHICSSCCNDIHRAYEFSLNVRLSDEKLRQELEISKNHVNDDSMENVQVLENEYFTSVDDDDGMQVCVMEEILDQDMFIVEEINDVEEVHIDEFIDDPSKSDHKKDNMLIDLAQVAASQENVSVKDFQSSNDDCLLPEDENDEDYLIEFDVNKVNNFKPTKWKCGECKIILRGDVSYEGHMNLHRQSRPHKCLQCQANYRCRSALKRHKDLRHRLPSIIENSAKITYICTICSSNFYAENILYLHQVICHGLGDKCPFQCVDENVNNLKEHTEVKHQKELYGTAETFCIIDNITSLNTFQCFRCSKILENFNLLQSHFKECQIMYESLSDDDKVIVDQNNVIKITKVDCTQMTVECNICHKKLLKKNITKHMELHKRKDEVTKEMDDTKPYLCAFCPREFKNSKSLHQHEKSNHSESSDVTYICADCDRQYASQYLLETHRKQAHKERDNVCTICGNAFKLKNQLDNHMKLHLEKNIPCPHCDKKYARQFDLNVHLRSHTGEQPYACHLCDRRFAIKVRLTYHLQKHYGIKHTCKECEAEFNSKQKLKAHSFKHTGMPYRCQLCDDHGFATRNTFKRHLTRVHHASISDEALNEMFQKNTGKSVNIKQIYDKSLVVCASEDGHQ